MPTQGTNRKSIAFRDEISLRIEAYCKEHAIPKSQFLEDVIDAKIGPATEEEVEEYNRQVAAKKAAAANKPETGQPEDKSDKPEGEPKKETPDEPKSDEPDDFKPPPSIIFF